MMNETQVHEAMQARVQQSIHGYLNRMGEGDKKEVLEVLTDHQDYVLAKAEEEGSPKISSDPKRDFLKEQESIHSRFLRDIRQKQMNELKRGLELGHSKEQIAESLLPAVRETIELDLKKDKILNDIREQLKLKKKAINHEQVTKLTSSNKANQLKESYDVKVYSLGYPDPMRRITGAPNSYEDAARIALDNNRKFEERLSSMQAQIENTDNPHIRERIEEQIAYEYSVYKVEQYNRIANMYSGLSIGKQYLEMSEEHLKNAARSATAIKMINEELKKQDIKCDFSKGNSVVITSAQEESHSHNRNAAMRM